MEGQPNTEGVQAPRGSRLWIAVLGCLIAWQGWLTLSMFDDGDPVRALLDERPIVSGSHPLHLYFGWLGASSLRSTGNPYCYDPAFQAGFPKTPVFDSGSRPAELFLTLAGGGYSPAAYKIGLAFCCLLVPVLLAVATRGIGLGWGSTCFAVSLGMVVWWGDPCRNALIDGDVDLLMGGLCAAAFVGLLLAFDRAAGLSVWLGLVVFATLGWLAHPFLMLLLLPLLMVYYLSVGPRHRLGWHVSLFTVLAIAPLLNSIWLLTWIQSWWLRLPVQFDGSLAHRTWRTFWSADCWGAPFDRALAAALFIGATAGVVILNQTKRRPTARLLGLGLGLCSLLTLAGMAWSSIGRFGTSQLVIPARWFAIPAAAFAITHTANLLGQITGSRVRGIAVTACALTALVVVGFPLTHPRMGRLVRALPLEIGLGPERSTLVESLRTQTTPDARILWEERTGPRGASRWSALLPVLTDRALIGGLGPDVCIEHGYAALSGQKLSGKTITDWSDSELEQFVRRYNIGWAVCWSPTSISRLKAWKDAEVVAELSDHGSGVLFSLKPRSFVLKGKAQWVRADSRHITLVDVVPEDGQVVVSLHYQTGLQVSPPRVQIEREPDPHDPIPLVRLRVPAPVSHLTLTWQAP